MASSVLSEYLNKPVTVICTDGSQFVGVLEGYDHSTNVALRDTLRRDLSPDRPAREEKLGLFVIRGDCVCVIGQLDSKIEAETDWSRVTAQPLKRFR